VYLEDCAGSGSGRLYGPLVSLWPGRAGFVPISSAGLGLRSRVELAGHGTGRPQPRRLTGRTTVHRRFGSRSDNTSCAFREPPAPSRHRQQPRLSFRRRTPSASAPARAQQTLTRAFDAPAHTYTYISAVASETRSPLQYRAAFAVRRARPLWSLRSNERPQRPGQQDHSQTRNLISTNRCTPPLAQLPVCLLRLSALLGPAAKTRHRGEDGTGIQRVPQLEQDLRVQELQDPPLKP
jgi:hypothetical protein